jgi:hypothetical protein
MATSLSTRARQMMAEWQRQEHVEDLDLVRAALRRARVSVTQAVLDFHETFAGYLTEVWGETGPLGIIHRTVIDQSWYEPMQVGGYLDGKKTLLACADIHLSWEMMIALDGTFYCNGPEAASYFHWVEQSAYLWEFSTTRAWRSLQPAEPEHEVGPRLIERLAGYRQAELCDAYNEVFGCEAFVVSVARDGRRCTILIAQGEHPDEFADIRPYQPPNSKENPRR